MTNFVFFNIKQEYISVKFVFVLYLLIDGKNSKQQHFFFHQEPYFFQKLILQFFLKIMNLFKLFGTVFGYGFKSSFVITTLFLCCFINDCYSKILTNSYLVEFKKPVSRSLADKIAAQNGYTNAGPVRFNFFKIFINLLPIRNDTLIRYLFLIFF